MLSSNQESYPFATPAKDLIRQQWDREVIEQYRKEYVLDRRLTYLGLPGARLLDVLAWREFVGHWVAVQLAKTEEDAEDAEELELNVMKNNLERDLVLLRANIDDVITAVDFDPHLKWPYDIVNLDYRGGLVHARGAEWGVASRHVDAITSLFAKQIGHPFLLFLTLNLRDKDRGELDKSADQVEGNLAAAGYSGIHERMKAHRDYRNAGLLKVYVPNLLLNHARQHTLRFRAPLLYHGTRQMMHFVVECKPFGDLAGGRNFSLPELIDALNLPLLALDQGDDLHQDDLGPKITLAAEAQESAR
jgi:hypothetical protein